MQGHSLPAPHGMVWLGWRVLGCLAIISGIAVLTIKEPRGNPLTAAQEKAHEQSEPVAPHGNLGGWDWRPQKQSNDYLLGGGRGNCKTQLHIHIDLEMSSIDRSRSVVVRNYCASWAKSCEMSKGFRFRTSLSSVPSTLMLTSSTSAVEATVPYNWAWMR